MYPNLEYFLPQLRALYQIKPSVTDDYARRFWAERFKVPEEDVLGWLNLQRARNHEAHAHAPSAEVSSRQLNQAEISPRPAENHREMSVEQQRHAQHLPTPFSVSPEPEITRRSIEPTNFKQLPNSPLSPHSMLHPELSPISAQRAAIQAPSPDSSYEVTIKDEMQDIYSPTLLNATLPTITSIPSSALPISPKSSNTSLEAPHPEKPDFHPNSFFNHVRTNYAHPQWGQRIDAPNFDYHAALTSFGESSRRILYMGKALMDPDS